MSNLPSGYSAGLTDETTVNITDNDSAITPVTLSFGRATDSVDEGNSRSITVNLSDDPGRTVAIGLSATNQGGATSGDYTRPTSLRFSIGERTKTISFAASADSDDHGETVRLGFANLPTGVTAGSLSQTVVSIDDDDSEVRVSFARASYTIPDGGQRLRARSAQPLRARDLVGRDHRMGI